MLKIYLIKREDMSTLYVLKFHNLSKVSSLITRAGILVNNK